MSSYLDAIIYAANGFAPVIQEFITKGLTQYVRFDEDGTPLGLGFGINSFYPDETGTTASVACVRAKGDVAEMLLNTDWTSLEILAVCPADQDIYEVLQADPIALEKWNAIVQWPEYIEDEDGNLVPNPQYGTFRPLARWA